MYFLCRRYRILHIRMRLLLPSPHNLLLEPNIIQSSFLFSDSSKVTLGDPIALIPYTYLVICSLHGISDRGGSVLSAGEEGGLAREAGNNLVPQKLYYIAPKTILISGSTASRMTGPKRSRL